MGICRGGREICGNHERMYRKDPESWQKREIGGLKMQEIKERAKELLASGQVQRVLGWKRGEDLPYNPQPAFFENEAQLEELVYDSFCAANLSKYMIQASKLEGKTLVFLKPCDTYSFNQLLKERRVDREKSYIMGVGCKG